MMGIFHKKRGNQESQNIPLDIQKAFEENSGKGYQYPRSHQDRRGAG